MANENDPGASTQQFQAYVEGRGSTAAGRRSGATLLIVALIVIAAVIAAVAFFVLR